MTKQITPLSAAQLIQLAAMQDHLNQLTCQANFGHSDWKSMDFNWGLAIVDEVMEIHGHLGWKWWKGSQAYNVGVTEENKKQIQLEVIDILHFGLSKWMQEGDAREPKLSIYDWGLSVCLAELPENNLYEYFAWDTWATLCANLDLDSSQIMEIYIGKYTLNIFRQDHGYGDGSYCKNWLVPAMSAKFQEDNWFLEQAIEEVKARDHEINVENITGILEAWYPGGY